MTTAAPPDASTSTSILIVDDDPDMRMLARVVLENGGIEVASEAVDGLSALERLHELDPPPVPTVVLLDNQMPGLTGLEVAARILEAYPGQLIVLFSAYLSPEIVQEAESLGIAACVPKTEAPRLARIIRDLVAAHGR